jgi:hypothetical protein
MDEEPPQNTADGKAKQLRGHHQHPLVYIVIIIQFRIWVGANK